jgi:hypothetical protein
MNSFFVAILFRISYPLYSQYKNKLVTEKLTGLRVGMQLDGHHFLWNTFYNANYLKMVAKTREKLGLTPSQYSAMRFSPPYSVRNLAYRYKELKFKVEHFGARKFALERAYNRGHHILISQEKILIGDSRFLQMIRKIWHCRELSIIKESHLHLKMQLEPLIEAEAKAHANAIVDFNKVCKKIGVRSVISVSASTSASTLDDSISDLSFDEVESLLKMAEATPNELICEFDTFVALVAGTNVDNFTS